MRGNRGRPAGRRTRPRSRSSEPLPSKRLRKRFDRGSLPPPARTIVRSRDTSAEETRGLRAKPSQIQRRSRGVINAASSTIIDVARKAGVSVSTVSHVINRTRRVMPETTRLVEAAIESIGYRPNTLARSLKTASSKSVGIAISAISNPYFSDIICAIETECARLGLMVFLSDTQDDPDRELAVVQSLHQRRVDGIILAPSPDPLRRALNYLEIAGTPVFSSIVCRTRSSIKSASRTGRRWSC